MKSPDEGEIEIGRDSQKAREQERLPITTDGNFRTPQRGNARANQRMCDG
jgi:hypothetical protein